MSKSNDALKSLELYIGKSEGRGLNVVVQLPLEIALRIQSLIQIQHGALQSADTLIDSLKKNYDKENSFARIDEDTIKVNDIIVKSALTYNDVL